MGRFLLLSGIVLCACFTAAAQVTSYTPVGELPASGLVPSLLPVAPVRCGTPPTLADIQAQSFYASTNVMSAARAAQLKITFFGSISGDYAKNDQVIIADFQRGKECLATDGSTWLLYGQTLRTTVRASKLEVSGSMTLALAAASATITNQKNFVKVESLGLPSAVQKLMLEAEKLASSGLTVENYSKFMDKVGEAKTKALEEAGDVVLIGVIEETTNDDLIRAVTQAFALENIKKGRSCLDAVEDYKRKDPVQRQIITDTYNLVAKGCDASSNDSKEKARQLLNNVEVKQK